MATAIEAETRARRGELVAEEQAFAARSERLSRARLVTFLGAAVPAGYGAANGLPAVAWAGVVVVAAAFVGLVVRHAFVAAAAERVATRRALVDEALVRIAGGVPERADSGERFAPVAHPYADDLDLFGARSVFRALCRAETGGGREVLARWLLVPAAPSEVRARQDAVRELLERPRFLEDLATTGRSSKAEARAAEPLLAWAEAPPELDPSHGLVRAARALVPLTLVGAALRFTLLEVGSPAAYAALVPFALQLLVLVALGTKAASVVTRASSREAPFGRYRALFALVEAQSFTSPRLAALVGRLKEGPGAARAIASLERAVGFADLRHNGVVHFVANVALLWDVFAAAALVRWKLAMGARVRPWIEAVSELEALASFAAYAREQPGHAFPELVDGSPRLEAEGAAHPLIDPAKRVANDVRIAADPARAAFPGDALLVTGSNMSGKSTYLRSVGLVAVMGLAGAPVCARRAVLSALDVRTSMRIRDALAEGTSHFYAEVKRLAEVASAASSGAPVLFLLDEILHGTNSRERILGARHVVADLVRKGAIGAVSSHDLGLGALEAMTDGRVRNVHFREEVSGDAMTFDYRLREGVVDTSNALRVMRLAGLDVPLDGSGEGSPP